MNEISKEAELLLESITKVYAAGIADDPVEVVTGEEE